MPTRKYGHLDDSQIPAYVLRKPKTLAHEKLSLRAFGTNPQSASLVPEVTKILDQKTTGSCVANAIAAAVRILIVQSTFDYLGTEFLSRLFVYYNARLKTNDQNVDNGTYPEMAYDALSEVGFPRERKWPFDPFEVNTKPNFEAYAAAFDQKWTRGVHAIEDGPMLVEDIKAALSSGHPVTFAIQADQGFEDYPTPTKIWDYVGPSLGGHYLCAVGYDDRGLWFVNSWAESWGIAAVEIDPHSGNGNVLGGFGIVGWGTVVDRNVCSNFWVPEIAPRFSE